MNLHGRLNRLEKATEASLPGHEAIRRSVRSWTEMAIRIALEDVDKGKDPDEFACTVLAAYEAAPATPGFAPRVIEPGWFGAADLDPGKVDVAMKAFVGVMGWPRKPYDITEVVSSDEYQRMAEIQDAEKERMTWDCRNV